MPQVPTTEVKVGALVGALDGTFVGALDGDLVGAFVGAFVPVVVGAVDGNSVGSFVGALVAIGAVGGLVETGVGIFVGENEGFAAQNAEPVPHHPHCEQQY